MRGKQCVDADGPRYERETQANHERQNDPNGLIDMPLGVVPSPFGEVVASAPDRNLRNSSADC